MSRRREGAAWGLVPALPALPAVLVVPALLAVLAVLAVPRWGGAQQRGELQFEALPSAGLIVDDPEAAVLVVETTVSPLSFQSRGGIRKVAEPEPGVYRVFLAPGVHRLEVRAPGYLVLRLPRWNFPPKSGRRIRVTARETAAGEGVLRLETRPAGAAIALNGVRIADRTPATLEQQKAGRYRIRLSGVAGYGPLDTAAVVHKGETTRLVLALPRLIAGLRVASDPAGALAVLDGDTLGQTPLARADLQPGDGTLAILLDGYEPNIQPVRLKAGETAAISAYLVRVTGRLAVTTTPGGAAVYVGDEALGEYRDAPLVRDKLAPGRYGVRAELEGYHPAADTAQVTGGRTTQVELTLRPRAGALYVVSSPVAGDLYLEGRPLGQRTPARVEGLAPGTYRVGVRAAGFDDGDTTVAVRSERTETVTVRLHEAARAVAASPPSAGAVQAAGVGAHVVRTPTGAEHELVHVPGGEFAMGSEGGDADERPVHGVYLDGYWLDKYEVTNAQWNVYAAATGKSLKTGPADHPVVNVSWFDARDYCGWAGLRLPTEAEWEKGARGTDGRTYPWGEAALDGTQANFADVNTRFSWRASSVDDGYGGTAPVGSFPSGESPYRAYDMSGNVWEWVSDWYGGDYYAWSPSRNPSGPSSGLFRVLRGGSWLNFALDLRAANRRRNDPSYTIVSTGFRCAQDE